MLLQFLQSTPEFAENFTGFTNYLNVITSNWEINASVPNIFGGYSFLVKKSIYNLQNYLVVRDLKDYYAPDDSDHWKPINI